MTSSEHPSLAAMRLNYGSRPFDIADLAADWWVQFDRWMSDAVAGGVIEPNAMVLATASADGGPASRNVLAKQVDESGVTFYTNYGSAKSSDLMANPRASVTFSWLPLHRQVHLRGQVHRVDAATTLAYWQGRPRGSQLGAWASPQSSVVPDRAALDELQAQVERRFGGPDLDPADPGSGASDIPVAPHWGGWRIEPHTVEFWQGRSARLHDRLRYRRNVEDRGAADRGAIDWIVERLAP